jgi:3-phosphoshikimate 1-carboxyvinyltransferase
MLSDPDAEAGGIAPHVAANTATTPSMATRSGPWSKNDTDLPSHGHRPRAVSAVGKFWHRTKPASLLHSAVLCDDERVTAKPWPAPTAAAPVVADVRVPGSKSLTNRALLLATRSATPSRLGRPLRSRDTGLMAAALRGLGAVVDDSDDETWTVAGGDASALDVGTVDVGNAGTVLRFVPPVAALARSDVEFDGDEAARGRPVAPLLNALRDLGVTIDDGDRGALPFTVRGTGSVKGGTVRIDASSSSQLVSALLLAAPSYDEGIRLRHVGERPVPNAPHLAMTLGMLRARGVRAEGGTDEWTVEPGPVNPLDVTIEPDLSSAAPFLAAALATGGKVRVLGWPRTTSQPGGQLPGLLERFGGAWSLDETGLTVSAGPSLSGADVDLRDAGELTPVIAALAALASSPSRLTGIDYLRGHETDRLAALARELTALGGSVSELDDGLAITPKPLRGGVFSTYDDHRLAMAAAVVGLVVPGVRVADIATTAKTMPDFTARWTAMLSPGGAAS